MKYAKPHLSFDEQLRMVVDRGMQVDDEKSAIFALRHIGYYRLSAYWHHWRMQDDAGELLHIFHPAARFEDSITLYSFDRRLRLVLLDAIERIEIALRVAIAYVAGRRHPSIHNHPEFLGNYASKVDKSENKTRYELCRYYCEKLWRQSSEDFAKHGRSKYEDSPAIWVVIETWDFGLLSNFFKMLVDEDKEEVASYFQVSKYSMFESWIASLNHVRNLCAHHSRLFRKPLVVRPGIKQMREMQELDHVRGLNEIRAAKIYPVLVISAFLMNAIDPESSWVERAVDFFESLGDIPTASLADYGFPDDWRSHSIWM